jgi:hypothetical protein
MKMKSTNGPLKNNQAMSGLSHLNPGKELFTTKYTSANKTQKIISRRIAAVNKPVRLYVALLLIMSRFD